MKIIQPHLKLLTVPSDAIQKAYKNTKNESLPQNHTIIQ